MDEKDKISATLVAIDRFIVEGNFKKAQDALKQLVRNKPARPVRAAIARLARRADLPSLSVRLLNPIVRVEGRKMSNEPTTEERSEYAYALNRLGAVDESIGILESIRTHEVPESVFLLGLAYISKWDYQKAITVFKDYVFQRKITEYQRLVGSINLASALIHEGELSEATAVLATVEAKAKKRDLTLLLGKCYYFEAELEILKGQPDTAIERLKTADQYLANSHLLDQVLSKMWKAIACLQKNPTLPGADALQEVKKDAKGLEAWEVIRNCDLHQGLFLNDETLLLRVYFGTSAIPFRKRMLEVYGKQLAIPDFFDWNIGKGKNPVLLDLENPESKMSFKTGSSLHRLYHVLTTDFYRTFRLAELHAQIYPEENYNPVSSPYKVKQGIKLLRKWFSDHKIPLEIQELSSRYFLTTSKSVTLRTRLEINMDRQSGTIDVLRERFPHGFSAKEAAEHLEVSHRTLLRMLAVALQEGKIKKTGALNALRYEFQDAQALAA